MPWNISQLEENPMVETGIEPRDLVTTESSAC
jgi:hypothetical protein